MPLYRALAEAIRAGEVRSAATPTRGGLGVCLAHKAMAGGLGLEIDLALMPGVDTLHDDVALFSESNGRFVVTVAPDRAQAFESRFPDLPCRRCGTVRDDGRLLVLRSETVVVDQSIAALRRRFSGGETSV